MPPRIRDRRDSPTAWSRASGETGVPQEFTVTFVDAATGRERGAAIASSDDSLLDAARGGSGSTSPPPAASGAGAGACRVKVLRGHVPPATSAGHRAAWPRGGARAIPARVPDSRGRRQHHQGDAAEGGIRPSASRGRPRSGRTRHIVRSTREWRSTIVRASGTRRRAPPELTTSRSTPRRARRPGRAGGPARGDAQGPFGAAQAPRAP